MEASTKAQFHTTVRQDDDLVTFRRDNAAKAAALLVPEEEELLSPLPTGEVFLQERQITISYTNGHSVTLTVPANLAPSTTLLEFTRTQSTAQELPRPTATCSAKRNCADCRVRIVARPITSEVPKEDRRLIAAKSVSEEKGGHLPGYTVLSCDTLVQHIPPNSEFTILQPTGQPPMGNGADASASGQSGAVKPREGDLEW
ncbi:MAG: hypothetical protein O3A01_05760 [bacterium]|nr:hypothetical protein [bacterium]